jgi:protoporphyrinogen oxidase
VNKHYDRVSVAILGTGMAGCGAIHRLAGEGLRPVAYDKATYFGGHTASFAHEGGYTFDEGGHVSFTKNERLKELFARNVGGEFERVHARINNYWHGHWIKHPPQCNLYGLPADLVARIIGDFVNAQNTQPAEIRNYRDWLLASYGKTFAETFPVVYGRRYHTTTPDNMTTDWLGPRMYRPTLLEVLKGALSPETPDVHYVTEFRYPSRGGFVSYIRPFADAADVRLDHQLVRLDPRERLLEFANGAVVAYDQVVSSIPLPAFLPLIEGVPADVREASQKLACTICVIVNIVVARPDLSDAHITYFYDEGLFFTRVNYPHMLSPHNVPPGTSAVQAECYYSKKYRPLDRTPESCVEPVVRDLRRCGILRDDDKILFTNARVNDYANIIFDLEYPAALGAVHGYLEDVGILACGRYGDWRHLWTDEAFESGERAAEQALDRLGSTSRR